MRSKNLSYYVNIQKSRILKLRRARRFWGFVKRIAVRIQGFLTSKWSFLPILILLFLFYNFPIDDVIFKCFPISGWSTDYYLTLWQVYGAIVGLSFVALFFSYEAFFSRVTSTFKNLEFRFRQEFYRKTLVQLLLFFNLFSLFYVGIAINTSRAFQSLTLLVISILSICFLFAKAVSFFESEEMEKTRLRILQSEIVDSVDAEVDRRLSTNLLLKIHEKNEYLKYELLAVEEEDRKPVRLEVSERKRISDIAIDKIISKMASIKGKFYLKKGIGEIVSPKYSIVGTVPKDVDEKTIKSLRKCFKLKREPARRDLHLALDDIEQQLLGAVDRRSPRDLSRFLEIYYHSLEEFLRTLRLYGIRYNPEQAKQGDFLHEWEPILQIQNDFLHLLESSIETGNKEIIRAEVYFIQDILDLSNENDDFLVFHRFKDFWLTIYCLALEVEDKSLRDFIIDLLLRTIIGFISTHLLLRLEHSEVNKQQIEKYREYVISSLLQYEQMLKATLDKKSLESLLKIDKNLGEVLGNYDPENHRPYVVEIEARLMDATLNSEEKKQLNEKLEIAKAKVQLKHDLDSLVLEIWLGIGGWITELYTKDKYNQEETAQFLKCAITKFKGVKNLASSYAATNTFYPSFSHAWKWWELEDKPSGVVVGLAQEEWLTRFYCIAGITFTPKEITADDSLDPTPNSESNLNAVKRQCSNILANSAKWSPVIGNMSSGEFTARAENFMKLHERAAEKQKAIESKWLIEQPLDEQKMDEFKNKITKSWENSSEMRTIIKKIGNYVDKLTVSENVQILGLQEWIPKNEFVKQDTIVVAGIEQFGLAMSRGEDKKICSVLLTNCSSQSVVEKVIAAKISEVVKQMKEKSCNANAILVGGLKIVNELQKTNIFKPRWEIKTSSVLNLLGFEGYFSELPVFFVNELDKNAICIVDLKKVGTFNQYRVQKSDIGILHFDIQFIDEKTAKEYVKSNPKLMENEKGEKLSEIKASSKLQQFVFVKILERFEFIFEDKDACNVLIMESDNTTPS